MNDKTEQKKKLNGTFKLQGRARWKSITAAKVLVACLVTPALWLNLSDSRNAYILDFIKGTYPRFIGHDLCEKI